MRVVFDVDEGQRVAISQVVVEGNKHFSDKQVVKHMATRPEGFWWFQKGEYDERKVDQDVRERLPRWYADHGFVDFQVTHDSLVADSAGGKAVLAPDRGGGPAVPGGDLRHRGQPAVLHRGAAGPLPLRPGRAHRHAGGRLAARSAAPSGTRPPRRCRTSTPTTATSTPRSSRARSGAPGRTASRWWTCGGPSARARRRRSTRSRSSATT